MIIQGKDIAEDILRELLQKREYLKRPLNLGVMMGAGDKATESFVRIKTRVAKRLDVSIVREELSEDAGTAQAIAAVRTLSRTCAGVIVQLPLPKGVDADTACASLPGVVDVDGIGPRSRVLPPVVGALREVLSRSQYVIAGKKALVVGQGRLVGAPASAWLKAQGAEVAVITEQAALADAASKADLIVLGAGAGGILRPEMIKEGVAILDAGTSESNGELRGDADARCASKASIFTPVPGGIGPIAVAMIFKNLFALAQKE